MGAVGILGEVMVFIRFAWFWRHERQPRTITGASRIVAARCQSVLMWSAAITCLASWKQLYDLGEFPYPFRPGDANRNYNQWQLCYGARSVPKAIGGPESITVTTGSSPGSKSEAP